MNYVLSEKIELLILGTHGRNKIEQILFGSVAEKVITMSTIPTLTINLYQVSHLRKLFDISLEGDESLEEELSLYK